MARKETVTKVDDLDGTPAESTVRFSLDSFNYEIDLSKNNSVALREVFSAYVAAGRKVKRAPRNERKAS